MRVIYQQPCNIDYQGTSFHVLLRRPKLSKTSIIDIALHVSDEISDGKLQVFEYRNSVQNMGFWVATFLNA